jgi:hypothetical protein
MDGEDFTGNYYFIQLLVGSVGWLLVECSSHNIYRGLLPTLIKSVPAHGIVSYNEHFLLCWTLI